MPFRSAASYHKNSKQLSRFWSRPTSVQAGRSNPYAKETWTGSEWLEEFSTCVKSAFQLQNPRKGSFNAAAETSIRKRSAWNQAVCIQKEPQYLDSYLSVVDGLLRNADDRLVSVLALLDLSAAFDSLDHPILLQRLETTIGISGTVLHWFASYSEGREQPVKVDNVLSSPSPLQFGVPQGSALGPILFTLYSQPLSDLICRHECDYHK